MLSIIDFCCSTRGVHCVRFHMFYYSGYLKEKNAFETANGVIYTRFRRAACCTTFFYARAETEKTKKIVQPARIRNADVS